MNLNLRRIYLLGLCGFILSACSARPHQNGDHKETTTQEHLSTNPPKIESSTTLLEITKESSTPINEQGFTLHIKPRTNRDLVAIQLWIRAGATVESPSQRGAAYVVHSLILGEDDDPTSLRAQLKRLGAQVSGWTSVDRSVIEVVGLPQHTQEILKLLSAHILKPDWSEKNVKRTLERLHNTHLTNRHWLNRRVIERLLKQTYDDHPNGRSTLPSPASIQKLNLSSLKEFYQAHYIPEKAHLICLGAVDESSIQKTIQDEWKSWESPQQDSSPSLPFPNLRRSHVEVEFIKSNRTQIQLAFPIQNLTPENVAYLDLISLLLVGDSHALLYQAARRAGVDIKKAHAFPLTPDGAGLFFLNIEVSSNQVDLMWKILLEQLSTLRTRPPMFRQLEQAKLLFEREMILHGERLSHQARRIAFFAMKWPNSEALLRYGRAIYQVRPTDLTAYLSDVFHPDRLNALIQSAAPKGVDAKLWGERFQEQIPLIMNPQRLLYTKGITSLGPLLSVLFQPMKSDGVISLRVLIPVKPNLTRSSELSLGHWLVEQMSSRHTHEPVFKALFHDEAISLSTVVTTHQIDDALAGIMRRIRQAPIRSESLWSSDTLEKARIRSMTQLKLQKRQPWQKLNYLQRRAHLAFDMGPLPSPSHRLSYLENQSSSELMRWYKKYVQSAPALLIVTGDLTETILSRALMTFATLKESSTPPLNPKTLRFTPKGKPLKQCRFIHETSNSESAWVSYTYTLAGLKQVDWPALALLEGVLTGPQFSLAQKLKEQKKHLQVYIKYHVVGQSPSFTILTKLSPKDLSLFHKTLQSTIQFLIKGPLPTEHLKEVKSFVKAQQTLHLSTTHQRAQWLGRQWMLGWRGVEKNGAQTWHQHIQNLTAEEIQRIAGVIFQDNQYIQTLISPPLEHKQSVCKPIIP